jgi:hypothetical protein
MNFIFMILLILIILLFFNIYLKQIKSSFYTCLILFVLIINELYFSKIEKFDVPSQPSYRLDYDFKQHMNKQMCLFYGQKKIINGNLPIISKCHKIFNRKSCDIYRECEYDTEFNRCNEKSNCSNIDTKPLKCHYMDNEETCNTLAQKMHKCENYKNKEICNKLNECKWNDSNKKCDYEDIACVTLNEDACLSEENNCKWEYYNDIYNAENNTNMEQCHSLDLLRFSGWIKEEISIRNKTKIQETLNDYLINNPDIKFYGLQKTDLGEYKLVFLKCDDLSTISPSKIQKYECLNENKYLGNNDNVMIYKRLGQCNTNSKCKWNDGDQSHKDRCNINSDEKNCLDDPECYYEYNSNKCLPKGLCESLNIYNEPTQISQGRAEYSRAEEVGRLSADGSIFQNGQSTNSVNTRVTAPIQSFNTIVTAPIPT